MANLGRKDDIFHIRFRFRGKEYKKSLKTRDSGSAEAAKRIVELTIHRLLTGQLVLPSAIDPGDFILSGGTLVQSPNSEPPATACPSTRSLIVEYTTSQKPLLAPSYHYSQEMHLRHLVRHLESRADDPGDNITHRDLDRFLKERLAVRHPNTVERERITLLQFYKWTVQQGYLRQSPATALAAIKAGVDRPPFRTIAEIQRIIGRGGLAAEEVLDLWECLYLTPEEIAGLLETVRAGAKQDYGYLLHALPAYTGMRRGEVLRLRWIDVDLEQGYICARSRKQSRRKMETVRRIDLHEELRKDLLAWREQRPRGQYVISKAQSLEPLTNDQANRSFWQPMRHTDWCLDSTKDWFKIGFHTYRHSFASNLAARAVDQRIIDEFMGHSTEAMRRRYRHLFPSNRRAAIECFTLQQPICLPET